MSPSDRASFSFVVIVTAALLSVACSSGTDDASSSHSQEMSLQKKCTRTECDAELDSAHNDCRECMSLCASMGGSCDFSSDCEGSCGADTLPTCSDDMRNTCLAQEYVADVPMKADPALEKACRGYFEWAAGCGFDVQISSSICSTWAKVEKPETRSNYECTSNLACDEDPSACNIAPSTFGDDFCAAIGATCGDERGCTDDTRAKLNADGSWLRDDVVKAGMSCAALPSCDDAWQCTKAWAEASGQ